LITKRRYDMKNTNKMSRTCRAALSVVAGVDERTRSQVAEMSMRSINAASQEKEDVINALLGERAIASQDYRF